MSAPNVFEKADSNSPPLAHSNGFPELEDTNETGQTEHEHGFEWIELIRIAFVTLAAAAVWFRVWDRSSALP